MRSSLITDGVARAPHRSLLRACGVADADFGKSLIAVVSSHVDIIPGHVHLQRVAEQVKRVIRAAGRSSSTPSASGDGIAWDTAE